MTGHHEVDALVVGGQDEQRLEDAVGLDRSDEFSGSVGIFERWEFFVSTAERGSP
jgi:hypothetical protein